MGGMAGWPNLGSHDNLALVNLLLEKLCLFLGEVSLPLVHLEGEPLQQDGHRLQTGQVQVTGSGTS